MASQPSASSALFPGHLGGDEGGGSSAFLSAVLIALAIILVVLLAGSGAGPGPDRKGGLGPADRGGPRPGSPYAPGSLDGPGGPDAPGSPDGPGGPGGSCPPGQGGGAPQIFAEPERGGASALFPSEVDPDEMWDAQQVASAEGGGGAAAPHSEGVYQALSALYSTEDVDPLVTGQAYAYRDNSRSIYDQRASLGGVWGMQEFSSSGGPGDVGVDVGPDGLTEYEGGRAGFDDGIPEAWRFPEDPVRWYKPKQRDYYGPEGATPYAAGLFSLYTPDHDPLIGPDEGPDY